MWCNQAAWPGLRAIAREAALGVRSKRYRMKARTVSGNDLRRWLIECRVQVFDRLKGRQRRALARGLLLGCHHEAVLVAYELLFVALVGLPGSSLAYLRSPLIGLGETEKLGPTLQVAHEGGDRSAFFPRACPVGRTQRPNAPYPYSLGERTA